MPAQSCLVSPEATFGFYHSRDWQDIPAIVFTTKDLTDEDRRIDSGRVERIVEMCARAPDQAADVVGRMNKRWDPQPA